MITAPDLIKTLQDRDFSLRVDGAQLIVRSKSQLTESDRQAIRDHKAALLVLLEPQVRRNEITVQGTGMPKDRCCFDDWKGKPSHEVVAELIRQNHCPDGCGPMNLQDRALDAWYCPNCRTWVIAGVIQ